MIFGLRASAASTSNSSRNPASIVDFSTRQNLQAFGQGVGFAPTVGLDKANDNIDAFGLQGARPGQHGVGLADARRRAQENPQLSASFLIRKGEQSLGIGSARVLFRLRHG